MAIVAPTKVRNYLLAATHRLGRAKARFFEKHGFRGDPDALIEALLRHVRNNAIADTERSSYGTKYRVDGPLISPDGRNPDVSTVWIVLTGELMPRFVTAFPC